MSIVKRLAAALIPFLCAVQALSVRVPARAVQKPELVVQTGHASNGNGIWFSPDGNILATAGYDESIKLWDIASGKELRTLTGHTEDISSLRFSPDGKIIASGSYDETIRLWDVKSGKELRTLKGHRKEVTSVAFSPDGTRLASGSRDWRVRLWDVATGAELKVFEGHNDYVTSVAYSPDGKTIASGGYQTVRLWDVDGGKDARVFSSRGLTTYIHSLAFSPDGKTLAAGCHAMVRLWDVESGERLEPIETDPYFTVLSVAFRPDGKTLISKTEKKVQFWDVESRRMLRELFDIIFALSPDGKTAASTTQSDRSIRLWNFESGEELKTLTSHSGFLDFIAFSPDGKALAVSAGGTGTINVLDLAKGREMKTLVGHTDDVELIAFSADGKLLASGSRDGTIRLWDVASSRELKTFKDASAEVMVFSPDGKTLVCGSGSVKGQIRMWDVATGNELRTLTGHTREVRSLAFSPDGNTLASGSWDETVKLWDVASGNELKTLKGHFDMAFSPDGKMLVSKDAFIINLWDPKSGELLQSANRDAATIWEVMKSFLGMFRDYVRPYSSNEPKLDTSDKLIAKASEGARIKIYDKETDKELVTLSVLDNKDWAVVAPDGRFDTNQLENASGLSWLLPDAPLTPLTLEVFMRDYFEPRLLPRLLKCSEEGNCSTEFKPIRDFSALNRTQPKITITGIVPTSTPGTVEVSAEVEDVVSAVQKDRAGQPLSSGVYDVRLFRDGQLVGHSTPDESLQSTFKRYDSVDEELVAWRGAHKVGLTNGQATLTFRVRLPHAQGAARFNFSAYAFNEDRVKSETSYGAYMPANAAPRATKSPRAYVVAFGVNEYENPAWNLRFAANDARTMNQTLAARLRARGEFSEVVEVSLLADSEIVNAKTVARRAATKGNIRTVFELLAGKTPPAEKLKELEDALGRETLRRVRRAAPDDLVIISFSSHGYADKDGTFYIVPTDIGKDVGKIVTDKLLARSISSDELSLWLRDVDAGEMIMIVDACHAASAVEGGEFKPGPMGSRGLGQLAFDKGMRILAATQADDIALESRLLKHGLLTYALIRDGIEARRADYRPKDNVIHISEWLSYGVERVPELYDEVREGRRRAVSVGKDLKEVTEAKAQQPSLFDFKRNKKDLILSVLD